MAERQKRRFPFWRSAFWCLAKQYLISEDLLNPRSGESSWSHNNGFQNSLHSPGTEKADSADNNNADNADNVDNIDNADNGKWKSNGILGVIVYGTSGSIKVVFPFLPLRIP